MSAHAPEDLRRIYAARFNAGADYRRRIWQVLIQRCFQRYARPDAAVLDLGCGYGEFINQLKCGAKYAMDLNPEAPGRLAAGIKCFLQDCSTRWPLPDRSLDLVFTSNFLEHLPDKAAVGRTLDEMARCLKTGGRLLAMGPNIKFLGGAYWDFWDHYVPLTEASLTEALETRGFTIERGVARFLPYTMVRRRQLPLLFLRMYLSLPFAWRVFGRQFLVVASKSSANAVADSGGLPP